MTSETVELQPEAKATSREWLGLAVIALPCMLYSMDLTVLNLAVPAIVRDLSPTASQTLWIIDIYGFMVAGFLMVMGALGDRFGRRRLLLIGAALFGATSIVAAFAWSAESLIVARAALGIAGATLAPSTLSLITNMFRDENERTFAISMWIASFSAGAVLGPVAGGVLLQYFWWGAVFLAGVPVMVLLLILGPWLLPEFRADDPPKVDMPSAALSLAAVLSLVYGVKRTAEYGFDGTASAAIVAGVVLAAAFVRRQYSAVSPMVDMQLFRSRVFSLSLAINILALFFMFGSFIFMAQYLQLVVGLTALEAGLWSLPGALAFTIMSFFNARLTAAYSAKQLFVGGLLLCAVGFTLLFFSHGLVPVVLAMILASVGFTPVIALTTAFIVGAVPPEKAGVASALSETAGELGGALGIALLGSLATYIYRVTMTAALPANLEPAIATDLATSLASALKASELLLPAFAVEIVEAARAAFMSGYHLTAALAALCMLLLAWFAHRVLDGQAETDQPA